MGWLLIFAFLSGLVTILAPCIWPLLPIVLAATSSGGRRKPLGVTLGIASSFAFFMLALSYILKIIPFNPSVLRWFAFAVISAMGLTLAVPPLSKWLEGRLSRWSGRFTFGGMNTGNGFRSGFITGCCLGVVWTPCAGPILATIATFAATQKVDAAIVSLTIAYVLGVSLPLFAFASLGHRIFSRSRALSPYSGRIQQGFGILMVLSAVAIVTNYDKTLQVKLLNLFPSYDRLVTGFDTSPAVERGLASLSRAGTNNADHPAPEFAGIAHWLNADRPVQLASLRGQVVLVDFWTYSCINCIRTLPHLTRWYEAYKGEGFVIVGVHTPEFQFEKDPRNVGKAVQQFHVTYPVALDNDYATWNAFENRYWPAEYLIDAQGIVRRKHFGEGEYDEMEMAIRRLLKEAGKEPAGKLTSLPDRTPGVPKSPETYFGWSRMEYYAPSGRSQPGKNAYRLNERPPLNRFSLGGVWTVLDEKAIPGKGALLAYHFTADQVYAVLRPPSPGVASTVRVYLDGKPIPDSTAGDDVKRGEIRVDSDRLYRLVNLKGRYEEHILRLEFQTYGTELFTFTFG